MDPNPTNMRNMEIILARCKLLQVLMCALEPHNLHPYIVISTDGRILILTCDSAHLSSMLNLI